MHYLSSSREYKLVRSKCQNILPCKHQSFRLFCQSKCRGHLESRSPKTTNTCLPSESFFSVQNNNKNFA